MKANKPVPTWKSILQWFDNFCSTSETTDKTHLLEKKFLDTSRLPTCLPDLKIDPNQRPFQLFCEISFHKCSLQKVIFFISYLSTQNDENKLIATYISVSLIVFFFYHAQLLDHDAFFMHIHNHMYIGLCTDKYCFLLILDGFQQIWLTNFQYFRKIIPINFYF